jgi:tetratricopeptide (TPR) repeat protein
MSGFKRPPKNAKASNSTTKEQQLDQIPPSNYTNDEAALEAGTQLEEKAERFAIGYKAKKYFELSLDMYKRAMSLNAKNQDAPYNCARVLFLLATDFYVAPKSINALQESTRLYRQSLALASPTEASDGMPSAFFLDVQFNLAVALLALADQLESSKDEVESRMNSIEEAIILFNSVSDGQELVLQRQKAEESDADTAATAAPEHNGETEEIGMDTDGEEGARSEYTTSLITPASALETLHNLHLSAMAMLDVVTDEISIQRALLLSTSSLQRGQVVFSAFPDGETRSPDNEWNDIASSLRFAPLEGRVAVIGRRSTLGLRLDNNAMDELTAAIQDASTEANALLSMSDDEMNLSTTTGRSRHRIHLQHLEFLGIQLLSLSRSQVFYLHTSPQDVSHCQQIWGLLGLTSKLFLATLKSLDTSTAGVGTSAVALGASNVSTATSRRRCSLYTSMSTLSIIRNDALFFSTLSSLDEKTRIQLANNARVYARKAITEIGLGWLLSAEHTSRTQYILPHGGMESLQGEVDAVLVLLRSLYHRSVIAATSDNLQEVQIICSNIKRGLLTGEHGQAWQRALFYPDGPNQGQQLLEQTLAEEGEVAVSQEERHFWAQVESSLL